MWSYTGSVMVLQFHREFHFLTKLLPAKWGLHYTSLPLLEHSDPIGGTKPHEKHHKGFHNSEGLTVYQNRKTLMSLGIRFFSKKQIC